MQLNTDARLRLDARQLEGADYPTGLDDHRGATAPTIIQDETDAPTEGADTGDLRDDSDRNTNRNTIKSRHTSTAKRPALHLQKAKLRCRTHFATAFTAGTTSDAGRGRGIGRGPRTYDPARWAATSAAVMGAAGVVTGSPRTPESR